MRFVVEIPYQLIFVEEEKSQTSTSTILQPVMDIFDYENVSLDGIMDVWYTFSIALCVGGGGG